MIEKVVEIGKALDRMGRLEEYSGIFEDLGNNYMFAIPIEVYTREKVARMGKRVEITETLKAMIPYRKGNAHRDLTPVSKITSADKTLRRIKNWFKYFHHDSVYTILEESSDYIEEEMKRMDLGGSVLTVVVDGKWPSQYLDKEELENMFLESFGFDEEGMCYLCGKSGLLSGDAISRIGWKFYNLDKATFLPMFNRPTMKICRSCTLLMIAGKNFIEMHLTGRQYIGSGNAIEFFAIPYGDPDGIEAFLDRFSESDNVHMEDLYHMEKHVSDILEELKGVRIDIVFFERNKQSNEMKIKKEIYGLMPSRLTYLHEKCLEISDRYRWHLSVFGILDDANGMSSEKFSILESIYHGRVLDNRRLERIFKSSIERVVKDKEYEDKADVGKYFSIMWTIKFMENVGGVSMWREDYGVAELVGRMVGHVHKLQKRLGRSRTILSLLDFQVNGRKLQKMFSKAVEIQAKLVASGEIGEGEVFQYSPTEKIKSVSDSYDYSFPFLVGIAKELFSTGNRGGKDGE